jgi:hypothetical protein
MNFWLRNIILGTILIGLATALLLNQDLLFSLSQGAVDNINKTSSNAEDKRVVEVIIDPSDKSVIRPAESKNAAADGLSRFYANLHGDADEKGPKIIKNIAYLPEPRGDLKKILEARRLITRPLPKNWTGRTETHPFRLGETLFQKLSQYSQDNGLEAIWWLNRDFLVKDAFRVNKDILATAYQVGKAIEGHFENGLSIYFCNKQRAIVLIEYTIPYLINECILLRRPGG